MVLGEEEKVKRSGGACVAFDSSEQSEPSGPTPASMTTRSAPLLVRPRLGSALIRASEGYESVLYTHLRPTPARL